MARSRWSRWRINTGPLIAGVIGRRKFAYDIWGDTVNGDEVAFSRCSMRSGLAW